MELASVHQCRACPLSATRHSIVDGEGPLDSTSLWLGEGPGFQEDMSGAPFVGDSGKILRTAVAKATLQLGLPYPPLVRYTNAVRCRPPNNRDPEASELAACRPWLVEELDAMPNLKLIVAVGLIGEAQARAAVPFMDGPPPQILRIMHPAYVMRQRRQTPAFERQIEDALRLANGMPDRALIVPEPWTWGEPDLSDPDLSMDTETDDLEEGVGVKMVGWSIGDKHRGLFVVDRPPILPPHVNLWNAKYDIPLLGIDPYDFAKWDDPMLRAYVLRLWERIGLKEFGTGEGLIIWKHKITDPEILGKGKKKRPFSAAILSNWPEASEYAATDAVGTARGAAHLAAAMLGSPLAEDYYQRIEKPLVPILLGMETRGILIDLPQLESVDATIIEQLKEPEALLAGVAQFDGINLDSPVQLGPVLLDMGLVDGSKSETGNISAGKPAILAAFQVEKPEQLPQTPEGWIAAAILERRHLKKLKSTYVDAIGQRARAAGDGRIHPRFNQAATDSDRLSSDDPNGQNIPTRGSLGAAIRRSFVAAPGYTLVVGDYSQLELRIWAEVTQDPFFLGAFVGDNPYDPHGRLSKQLIASGFNVPRDDAKNTNFAALYGADDAKIAATAKIPRLTARAFIEQLRSLAPSLSSHKLETRSMLERQGHAATLVGWHCVNPLFFSPVRREQAEALRAVANCRIQGTASGIVKDWMIALDEVLLEFDLRRIHRAPGGILLQVHDELVIEVPTEKADRFGYRMEETAVQIGRKWLKTVPLKLPVDVGPNWSDAKPK